MALTWRGVELRVRELDPALEFTLRNVSLGDGDGA
jgi:hypothetical protein